MEIFVALFEAILWALDLLVAAADVYSWIKGKPNRVERKEAKRAGQEPPPKDRWNRRVIVLTLSACILTLALVMWRSALD